LGLLPGGLRGLPRSSRWISVNPCWAWASMEPMWSCFVPQCA
jgi:hypothetical protein